MILSHVTLDILISLFFAAQSAPTFDCWKPLLHDESKEPSTGKLLKEILTDPRIKGIWCSEAGEIILENVWQQKFGLEYVQMPSGEMSAHARKLEDD